MNKHNPAKWWEHHSPDCSTKYRGCAPECPKARFERILETWGHDKIWFKGALARSIESINHWNSRIKELKRQIETLEVRLQEEEILQDNMRHHIQSMEE